MDEASSPVCFNMEWEDRSLTATFQVDEWRTLNSFLRYCRDLERVQLVQQGLPMDFSLQGNNLGQLKTFVTLPNDDLIAAFLHRMRPIILQNERTHFFDVTNILARRIDDTEIRNGLKGEREIYRGVRVQSAFKFYVGDELINSERMLNIYLNAYEYHTEEEKKKKLSELHGLIPLEFSRAIFLILLGEKAGSAFRIAEFIRKLVDLFTNTESPPFRDDLVSFDLPPTEPPRPEGEPKLKQK